MLNINKYSRVRTRVASNSPFGNQVGRKECLSMDVARWIFKAEKHFRPRTLVGYGSNGNLGKVI